MNGADDLKLHFNFLANAEAMFEECIIQACLKGETPLNLKQFKKRQTKLKKMKRMAIKAV